MSGGRGLHSGWGEEGVLGRARGGTVAIQAAGVARSSSLSAIAVDGGLQLTRRAQTLLLTLKRVQILHIPAGHSSTLMAIKFNQKTFTV